MLISAEILNNLESVCARLEKHTFSFFSFESLQLDSFLTRHILCGKRKFAFEWSISWEIACFSSSPRKPLLLCQPKSSWSGRRRPEHASAIAHSSCAAQTEQHFHHPHLKDAPKPTARPKPPATRRPRKNAAPPPRCTHRNFIISGLHEK